jgi:integrase
MTEYGTRFQRYEMTPNKVIDTLKSPEPLNSEFISNVRKMALDVEKKLRGNLLHPSIRTRAKNAINELGITVNTPVIDYSSTEDVTLPDARISPHFIDVCTIVAKAAAEAVLHEYGKSLGLPGDASLQKIVGHYKEGVPEPHLTDLWEAYYQEKMARGAWRDRTARKNQDAFRVVIDIIGDINVSDCGSEATSKLLHGLTHYPKNKNKYREFRDLPFSMEMCNAERFEPISTEHINFHIELMSSVFKFAKEDPKRWRTDRNPFENKQVEDRTAKKPNEKKRPFTKDEIAGIFVELSKVRRAIEPEKFWVPLVSLYSGMRINEVCQMRTCDIMEIDGVMVLQVLHQPEFFQETKNTETRNIPIHNTLLELGFFSYVQGQKKKKEDRLFANLTAL